MRVYANEERGKRGGKSSLAHVLPSFPSSFPPPPLPFFLLFIRSGHACGAAGGEGRGGEGRRRLGAESTSEGGGSEGVREGGREREGEGRVVSRRNEGGIYRVGSCLR